MCFLIALWSEGEKELNTGSPRGDTHFLCPPFVSSTVHPCLRATFAIWSKSFLDAMLLPY